LVAKMTASGVVLKETTHKVASPGKDLTLIEGDANVSRELLELHLAFQDHLGHRYERDPNGVIRAISPS
jgi:hypothetical protein